MAVVPVVRSGRPRQDLGDRHHLHQDTGRLCLSCVVIEFFCRRVVGWSMQGRQTTDVVLQAQLKAGKGTATNLQTREDAKRDVFDNFEMFYNPKRKHVRNGMLSPDEFERQQKLEAEGV